MLRYTGALMIFVTSTLQVLLPCVFIDLVSELVLSVEGCICGEVELLGTYRLGWPYGSPHSLHWFSRFIDIWNTNIDSERFPDPMSTVMNAILGYPRATTGKRLWYSIIYLMWHRFCSNRTEKFLTQLQSLRRRFVPLSWWEKSRQIGDVFNDVVWMRRYMVTKNDFIGFVPHNTQLGDKICILFGGRVLFVIRKVPGESRREEISQTHHPWRLLCSQVNAK